MQLQISYGKGIFFATQLARKYSHCFAILQILDFSRFTLLHKYIIPSILCTSMYNKFIVVYYRELQVIKCFQMKDNNLYPYNLFFIEQLLMKSCQLTVGESLHNNV